MSRARFEQIKAAAEEAEAYGDVPLAIKRWSEAIALADDIGYDVGVTIATAGLAALGALPARRQPANRQAPVRRSGEGQGYDRPVPVRRSGGQQGGSRQGASGATGASGTSGASSTAGAGDASLADLGKAIAGKGFGKAKDGLISAIRQDGLRADPGAGVGSGPSRGPRGPHYPQGPRPSRGTSRGPRYPRGYDDGRYPYDPRDSYDPRDPYDRRYPYDPAAAARARKKAEAQANESNMASLLGPMSGQIGRAEGKIAGASDRALAIFDGFMLKFALKLVMLPFLIPWLLLKKILGSSKRAGIAVLILVIVLTSASTSGAGISAIVLSLVAALVVMFTITLVSRLLLGFLTVGHKARHLDVLASISRQSFGGAWGDRRDVIDVAITLFKIQALILALGWVGNLLTTIGLRGPGSWPLTAATFIIWPLPLIVFLIFVVLLVRQVISLREEVLVEHGPSAARSLLRPPLLGQTLVLALGQVAEQLDSLGRRGQGGAGDDEDFGTDGADGYAEDDSQPEFDASTEGFDDEG